MEEFILYIYVYNFCYFDVIEIGDIVGVVEVTIR